MKTPHIDFYVFLVISVTITIFFLMNFFTIKITDDFCWEYISGTQEKVQSVFDIFPSIYNYYMGPNNTTGGFHGGRIVAVFLTQFFVFLGKNIFNIANTIVYILFTLLMYFHITGTIKKINVFLYGAINIFAWYTVPAWGQNLLWLTGSCFYLWPLTIILFFLVPLHKKCRIHDYNINFFKSLLYLILGLLAGLSYENVAAAVFVLLFSYFIFKLKRKERPVLFEILGTIGFLTGFIILIVAPGNYERLNSYEIVYQYGFFKRVIIRFIPTTQRFFLNSGFLLTGFSSILGIEIFYHQKRTINLFSVLFLLAGITAAYSMLLSPVFSNRTFFPVSIFLIIALLSLFQQITFPEMILRNRKLFAIIMFIFFSFSVTRAGVAIVKSYRGDKNINVFETHYANLK
ncbi:MAG: DUF6056 family protein [Treponema sp.]|nr:DUF6056 family protein [Treponema sp.]